MKAKRNVLTIEKCVTFLRESPFYRQNYKTNATFFINLQAKKTKLGNICYNKNIFNYHIRENKSLQCKMIISDAN